jgi:uncharacterized protein YqgV (UPF0045/DUF77 family)
MHTSVEITLYPLETNYLEIIQDFIDRLNAHPGLSIRTNAMSTQVFGPYAQVWAALTAEMQHTHAQVPQAAFVIKALKNDVSQP